MGKCLHLLSSLAKGKVNILWRRKDVPSSCPEVVHAQPDCANNRLLTKMLRDYVEKSSNATVRLLNVKYGGDEESRWILSLERSRVFVLLYTHRDDDGRMVHIRTSFPQTQPLSEEAREEVMDQNGTNISVDWKDSKKVCLISQEVDMDFLEGGRDFDDYIDKFLLITRILTEEAATYPLPSRRGL